jgi:hypothetical protein
LLAVMDNEAREFAAYFKSNPLAAITEPLPESLDDLDASRHVRSIVYAVTRTLSWSPEGSFGLIGRLAEIDRALR